MKILIIQGNEKNTIFWSESRELNLVLRKLRSLSESYTFQKGRFRKSALWMLKFFGEIMKGQSKSIFLVIFHIYGVFKNAMK